VVDYNLQFQKLQESVQVMVDQILQEHGRRWVEQGIQSVLDKYMVPKEVQGMIRSGTFQLLVVQKQVQHRDHELEEMLQLPEVEAMEVLVVLLLSTLLLQSILLWKLMRQLEEAVQTLRLLRVQFNLQV